MKLLALGVVSAVVIGSAAFAQDDVYVYDDGEVSVTEDIIVTIPNRVALHLQEDEWNLDLDDLDEFDEATGEGCLLIPKDESNLNQNDAYIAGAINLSLYPVASYPAVIEDGDGGIKEAANGYLKGGLLCVNEKVVQKFSNAADGWTFSADVDLNEEEGDVGQFYIADTAEGSATTNDYLITDSEDGLVLASGEGTTGGFLDDFITEAFFFDGSEEAGEYNTTVTFTLAGNF